MKKYFLHINGANAGPYSYEELRAMRIQKTTPVWYDGLGNWKNAGDVMELKSLFTPGASTFTAPQNYSNPAQRSTYNFQGNMPGNTVQKKSNGTAVGIIVGIAVLIMAGAGIFIYMKKKQEERLMNELMYSMDRYKDEATEDMPIPDEAAPEVITEAAPPMDYGSSTYAGHFNNYSGGIVTVTGSDDNSLYFSIKLDPSYGCSGELSGKATVIADNKLQVRTSSGCKLTIKYSVGFVTITESPGCSSELASGCSFEGIYSKE